MNSFLDGLSRVFDITGVLRKSYKRKFKRQHDYDAIQSDFEMIGKHFEKVLGQKK